ncbi:hypothetical protein CKO15_10315 [Halorhodospira abdelmalekii]|nr:hypothetical protein [Halorhodospira abdelmalekii]
MDKAGGRLRIIPGDVVQGAEAWEVPDFEEPERERQRQIEREEAQRLQRLAEEKRQRQRQRRRQAVYERLRQEDEARRVLPSEHEIEQIHAEARRQGYQTGLREGRHEGYHAGYPEGLRAGEADGRQAGAQLVQQLRALLDTLGRPLEQLDREIEDELSHLVYAVARRMVLEELRTEPAHTVAAVKQALRELPANQRWVSVHLNPAEIAFVEEQLGADEARRGWSITADHQVTRGGCIVRTEISRVDASVERRLDAIAEQLLGDAHAAEESDSIERTYRGGSESREHSRSRSTGVAGSGAATDEAAAEGTEAAASAADPGSSTAGSAADAAAAGAADRSASGGGGGEAAGSGQEGQTAPKSRRRRPGRRASRRD